MHKIKEVMSVLSGEKSYQGAYPCPSVDKEDIDYEKAKAAWLTFKDLDLNSILLEDKACQVAIDEIGSWGHVCAMKAMKDRYVYFSFFKRLYGSL